MTSMELSLPKRLISGKIQLEFVQFQDITKADLELNLRELPFAVGTPLLVSGTIFCRINRTDGKDVMGIELISEVSFE